MRKLLTLADCRAPCKQEVRAEVELQMTWLGFVKRCPNTKIICKDQHSIVFAYLFGLGVGGGGSMFLRKSL